MKKKVKVNIVKKKKTLSSFTLLTIGKVLSHDTFNNCTCIAVCTCIAGFINLIVSTKKRTRK